jgi:hypothetical protein
MLLDLASFLQSDKELFTTRYPDLKLLAYHLKNSLVRENVSHPFPNCRG